MILSQISPTKILIQTDSLDFTDAKLDAIMSQLACYKPFLKLVNVSACLLQITLKLVNSAACLLQTILKAC